MTGRLGRLDRDWMADVQSNLDGSGQTLLDLVAERYNANTDDVEIDSDGSVYDGQRWLDADDVLDLVAWIEQR